jgi:hypothetical protein
MLFEKFHCYSQISKQYFETCHCVRFHSSRKQYLYVFHIVHLYRNKYNPMTSFLRQISFICCSQPRPLLLLPAAAFHAAPGGNTASPCRGLPATPDPHPCSSRGNQRLQQATWRNPSTNLLSREFISPLKRLFHFGYMPTSQLAMKKISEIPLKNSSEFSLLGNAMYGIGFFRIVR